MKAKSLLRNGADKIGSLLYNARTNSNKEFLEELLEESQEELLEVFLEKGQKEFLQEFYEDFLAEYLDKISG